MITQSLKNGGTEMKDVVVPLVELVKDPVLVFILLMFGIMGWVIYSLLKTIKSQVAYERELVAELGGNAKTLARLTALIETLVHGRGGHKHD